MEKSHLYTHTRKPNYYHKDCYCLIMELTPCECGKGYIDNQPKGAKKK